MLYSIKEVSVKSKRVRLSEPVEVYFKNKIVSPKTCAQILHQILEGVDNERFYSIIMGGDGRIIGIEEVSRGGPSVCPVHIPGIFRTAIVLNASTVIIAHNHPSGSKEPSEEDLVLTDRVKLVGEMIDIPVLDHLIVTNDSYFSLAERGLLSMNGQPA